MLSGTLWMRAISSPDSPSISNSTNVVRRSSRILARMAQQDPLVLLALERGGRTAGAALEDVGILDAALGEDVLDPAAAAKVAHLPAGDPVQPAGGVGAVEGVEPAAHDQEDLLHDVVAIGLGAAERADPARDLLEPGVVERAEVLDGRPATGGLHAHRSEGALVPGPSWQRPSVAEDGGDVSPNRMRFGYRGLVREALLRGAGLAAAVLLGLGAAVGSPARAASPEASVRCRRHRRVRGAVRRVVGDRRAQHLPAPRRGLERAGHAGAARAPRGPPPLGAARQTPLVEIIDLGVPYRIIAAGQVREYRDESRDCAYRARIAAVFVALAIDPGSMPARCRRQRHRNRAAAAARLPRRSAATAR